MKIVLWGGFSGSGNPPRKTPSECRSGGPCGWRHTDPLICWREPQRNLRWYSIFAYRSQQDSQKWRFLWLPSKQCRLFGLGTSSQIHFLSGHFAINLILWGCRLIVSKIFIKYFTYFWYFSNFAEIVAEISCDNYCANNRKRA